MSNIQDEIVDELAKEFNISKHEINKIIQSPFRLMERIITNKECKTINFIGLGKFYPTAYRKRLEDGKSTGNS